MESKKSCLSFNPKNPVLTNRMFILQKSGLSLEFNRVFNKKLVKKSQQDISIKDFKDENKQTK